jgi:AcrR family transcriptional regulator
MSTHAIVASAEDLSSRARLRDAAVRLFAERGVAGTSVRDIAEAAGVTAGLITHHFGSKERLKAAVDELMVEVFTAPLAAHSDRPSPTADAVAEALAHSMAAHPDLRAYLRRSFLENDPASAEVFDRFVGLCATCWPRCRRLECYGRTSTWTGRRCRCCSCISGRCCWARRSSGS